VAAHELLARPVIRNKADWRYFVDVREIVAQIDAEIAKLQQARALLAGSKAAAAGRGRPKGSKNVDPAAPTKKVKKRKLSPEGRKRIADAMKKRWAERRRLLAKS
jgi:hypothetical protein